MAVHSDILGTLQTVFLKRFAETHRLNLPVDETTHITMRATGQRLRAVSGCA